MNGLVMIAALLMGQPPAGGWPGVLANDRDPDGDTLVARLVRLPAHGTVQFSQDGHFTYTPAADYVGTDTFAYVASDGWEDGPETEVTIVVNGPPVVTGGSYELNQDTVLTTGNQPPLPSGVVPYIAGLLDSAIDPEQDKLTASIVTPPQHGTLVLTQPATSNGRGGHYTYTPAPGWSGTDSVVFRCTDGWSESNQATMTFVVRPTVTPPNANADRYSTPPGHLLEVPASAGVLANDASNPAGRALSARVVTQPTHGVLAMAADGSFSYMPNEDHTWRRTDNPERFTYIASDGAADSPPVEVVIYVNTKPESQPDRYTVPRGGALSTRPTGATSIDSQSDSYVVAMGGAINTRPPGTPVLPELPRFKMVIPPLPDFEVSDEAENPDL